MYLIAMKKNTVICPLFCLLSAPVLATEQSLDVLVNNQLSGLVDTDKGMHEHPELSHHEEHTSALLAGELREAGYTVTERVGNYPDGSQAYGLVAIALLQK